MHQTTPYKKNDVLRHTLKVMKYAKITTIKSISYTYLNTSNTILSDILGQFLRK